MDFQTLSRVIEELSSLAEARVERVFEDAWGAFYLALERNRKHYFLLFSPDRSMPRIHLVAKKPAASVSPSSFCLYLRGRVTGARITGVSLLNRDRIAELLFSRQGAEEYRLVFELIGSASNIIFTDASSSILAVYYPVPPGDTIKRPLLPGLEYFPPERNPARIYDADPPSVLGNAALFEENRKAENWYACRIAERNNELLRAELRRLVRKAHTKSARTRQALTSDLDSACRADEYRRAGDLILANLTNLNSGLEHALLMGYDGESFDVRLDPGRSPSGNAERYFKKYKKAKAGRSVIEARLKAVEAEAERLGSLLAGIEQAAGADELEAIRTKLVRRGYLREREEKGGKRILPAQAPFRTIEYAGWEILVGRSAAGNDYLTMKIARPHDLWLHAEGMPGSHVVIRNPDGGAVPPEVFRRAASLAAFYSKGKSAGKVAVTYTLARHVKKPKGAKPGLVTLSERKTIMAVPETG